MYERGRYHSKTGQKAEEFRYQILFLLHFILTGTNQSPMRATLIPCEGSTSNFLTTFYQALLLSTVVLNLPNATIL